MSSVNIELVPLLPLRDVVVFPHMIVPLFVGRTRSVKALELAVERSSQVVLATQKDPTQEEPDVTDIHKVGTLANIMQLLKLPDGTVKVLVEGTRRVSLEQIEDEKGVFLCSGYLVEENEGSPSQQEALRRTLLSIFDEFAKLHKKIPAEVVNSLSNVSAIGRFADTIASHMPIKLEDKQQLLETADVIERMEKLLEKIEIELDIAQVERKIRSRVKRQMEDTQRNFYLNEQMKAIQKELGEEESETDQLQKRIDDAKLPKEVHERAMAELKKLKMSAPMSAESTVVRNYLDQLLSLPWRKKTKLSSDLQKASDILDQDHFGLEKVKERILEYLAVHLRADKAKSPILCLVGPPGVGKTSLGESIARATGRKFVRMALGGVHDEAEIRGHRRTYIGSMPGKVLQSMIKAGVKNPLFLLDEVDKMGADFRGDPASALLEVLDPEQNHSFQDHYIEVDYDLSDVLFVATANSTNIPPALLDRMEIIRLSGYTEEEKMNIANRYLVPKQIKNNGIRANELEINEEVIRDIIRYYTREAGVRGMEREISKICRKALFQIMKEKQPHITVTPDNEANFLGVRRFHFGMAETNNQVGQVTGLAWTEVGGDLLTIEAVATPGKGNIIRTGSLGDVMKESVEAARTVVRSRADQLGINVELFEKQDLHLHVPEGATPKDGPSAGAAMTTAIISAMTKIPVLASVAMTGEITLRGEVLAIGGLKEKLLAALRGGIKTVLIPEENVKDLAEIPANVKNGLEIVPVRWIDQVLDRALATKPKALENKLPTTSTVVGTSNVPASVSDDTRH
jgi:ATP-dependent Lon protease